MARQRWYAALGVLTLLLATVLTWLVSRSITKPLRSLTNQAKEMAEHRLPDAVLDILETPLGDDVAMPTIAPVRVNTRDEVADVADALNTVQDTALDLAVEQAVLRRNIADSFVNLGRRNQNLLGRQLDFITELETNEADPDTLANLFRLDHLATRMRRNAESLLVLAGIEPPRKWAAPVRLTDVIRAALGEVEDYQRVTVRGVEPATIMGSAAADLAHLLAELIENALVFSPPDQTVDIRGRNRPDGYTLAIIDSGLGMPTTDVTAANRRLAGAESFTIAPSKYLGHYVAGNLAARHNITVHLDNSPGNGITATIDIPPTLLTTEYAQPHADEPHAAREVWPPAPREVDAGDPAPPALPAPGPGRLPATHSYLPAAKSAYPPVDAPAAGGALPPILEHPAAPVADTPAAGGIGRPLAYPRAQFGAVPTAPPSHPPAAPFPTDLAGQPPAPDPTPAPAAAMWQPPAPPVEDPAAVARRTASGLVKRTPRVVDTGQVPAMRNEPTEDLLASLSRYTQGRESATGATPAVTGPTAHTGQMPATPPPLPSRNPGTGPAIPTRGDLGNGPPPLPTRGDPATPLPTRGDLGNGPAMPTRGDLGNGPPPLPTRGDPTAPTGTRHPHPRRPRQRTTPTPHPRRPRQRTTPTAHPRRPHHASGPRHPHPRRPRQRTHPHSPPRRSPPPQPAPPSPPAAPRHLPCPPAAPPPRPPDRASPPATRAPDPPSPPAATSATEHPHSRPGPREPAPASPPEATSAPARPRSPPAPASPPTAPDPIPPSPPAATSAPPHRRSPLRPPGRAASPRLAPGPRSRRRRGSRRRRPRLPRRRHARPPQAPIPRWAACWPGSASPASRPAPPHRPPGPRRLPGPRRPPIPASPMPGSPAASGVRRCPTPTPSASAARRPARPRRRPRPCHPAARNPPGPRTPSTASSPTSRRGCNGVSTRPAPGADPRLGDAYEECDRLHGPHCR